MDEIPALGAHTHAILAELGFAGSEIERLREQRVI
jgi:crotonobetainyl-CoA:carnitine CoA-transferase CaiB-like acyl-CoA transferase